MTSDQKCSKRDLGRRFLSPVLVCGLAVGSAAAHVRTARELEPLPERQPAGATAPSGDLDRLLDQMRRITLPEAPERARFAWTVCEVAQPTNAGSPARTGLKPPLKSPNRPR